MKRYFCTKQILIEQHVKRKRNNVQRAEYAKQYYQKNKISICEQKKQYSKENLEKRCVLHQTYIARKKLLPSTLTIGQWEKVKEHFNNKCCYCGKELQLTQEHFIALSKGGEYTNNNIIPSCAYCNSSKGNKSFFVWYPIYKDYSVNREKFILKYLNYKNKQQQLALRIN